MRFTRGLFLAACFALPSFLQAGQGQWPRPRPAPPTLGQLSPEGQRLLEEYEKNPGDVFTLFARLIETEARAARPWLEVLAEREAAIEGSAQRDALRRRMWERYLKHYDDPEGHAGLGLLLARGKDWRLAKRSLDKAIAGGLIDPELYYYRGLSSSNLGDPSAAQADAQAALALDPGDQRSQSLAKLSEAKIGQAPIMPKGALGSADEVAASAGAVAVGRYEPAAPPAADSAAAPASGPAAQKTRQSAQLTAVAQRHLQVGDAEAAALAAQNAAALNPDNVQALNLLATAQQKLGRHEAAVAAADRALAIQPDSVPVLVTRAWARNGLKDFTRALEDSARVLALDPANAFGFVSKGRALGGLGHREGMIDALAEAARLDGRFAQLHERALQLASGKDTELLFAEALPSSALTSPAKPRRRPSLLVMLGATVSGGLLVALGLMHVFVPGFGQKMKSTLRGLGRMSGESISGYKIERVVGTGGMGVVYEAKDPKLGRSVAIKKLRGEIRNDPKERKRFVEEARTVGRLKHPNIVAIHSVVDEGEDLYLIFEFVEGRTLETLMKSRPAMPWSEALAVLSGLCRALEHAHSQGVVHRDLKPANIMIDASGAVKVMDFGIARAAQDALTRAQLTNTVAGTPPYMAPEAEEGEIRKESDLYSLGVLLYEMATGRQPFTGSAGAMFNAKAAGRFPLPSEILPRLPKGLDAVIRRALDPHPQKRFASAKAFYEAAKQA